MTTKKPKMMKVKGYVIIGKRNKLPWRFIDCYEFFLKKEETNKNFRVVRATLNYQLPLPKK